MKKIINFKVSIIPARLVFGHPEGDVPPPGLSESAEAVPSAIKSAKKFATDLILISQSGDEYTADPKHLVRFINKSSSQQKIILAAWIKKQPFANKFNQNRIKKEALKIYKEISPRHKRSNLDRIKEWVQEASQNAARIAVEREKKKLEVVVAKVNRLFNPTVMALITKYAPNKVIVTDKGQSKQKPHPKFPKLVTLIKGYLKPKGIGADIKPQGNGFKIKFTCSKVIPDARLKRLNMGLKAHVRQNIG